jgi:hypothetical protein
VDLVMRCLDPFHISVCLFVENICVVTNITLQEKDEQLICASSNVLNLSISLF